MYRLIAAAALAVASFAAIAAVQASGSRARQDSLSKFARSHPECRVWTDWQRICARPAAGAAPHCLTDRHFNASASAPFCASGYDPDHLSPLQLGSLNRFCATTTELQFDKDGQPPRVVRFCTSYKQSRPFATTKLPEYFCRDAPPAEKSTSGISVKDKPAKVTPAFNLHTC